MQGPSYTYGGYGNTNVNSSVARSYQDLQQQVITLKHLEVEESTTVLESIIASCQICLKLANP